MEEISTSNLVSSENEKKKQKNKTKQKKQQLVIFTPWL